jgi:hypothetical protein
MKLPRDSLSGVWAIKIGIIADQIGGGSIIVATCTEKSDAITTFQKGIEDR